jgi:hypothetical protein
MFMTVPGATGRNAHTTLDCFTALEGVRLPPSSRRWARQTSVGVFQRNVFLSGFASTA